MLGDHGERVDPEHATKDLTLMARLVQELLDAHMDTVELALGLEDDLAWNMHLAYLRALQRQSRGLLARICAGEAI
jgi:hypothetical protein